MSLNLAKIAYFLMIVRMMPGLAFFLIITYGGRSTPARIAEDMADLESAAARDRAIFEAAMSNR